MKHPANNDDNALIDVEFSITLGGLLIALVVFLVVLGLVGWCLGYMIGRLA